MRLGLDLLFLIPDASGGRETYANNLIEALLVEAPALDVTAFVARDAVPDIAVRFSGGVRLVGVPTTARRPDRWAAGELLQLPVAAARARVDVVHSMANFAPVAGPFRRVVTLHDLQHRALPELITPLRRSATDALLRAAATRADRIITVSAASRDEIVADYRLAPQRIDVIPNGVLAPSTIATPSLDAMRERLGVGDRAVVLAVSTDLPHKNFAGLIRAVASIDPDRRPVLVLAGAGTDGAHLGAVVAETRLEGAVRRLGFVAPEELDALYALSACVVVPSLYEGFGLPALEAMARGTPLVCSDIAALREVAGEAALLVRPGDDVALAAAITRVLGNDPATASRARIGRERSRTFTWRAAARATLRSYRAALGVDGAA